MSQKCHKQTILLNWNATRIKQQCACKSAAVVALAGPAVSAGVTVGPVEAVTGKSACFAALGDQEGAVTVMLDFMDPPCTRRRVIS
jgi:hypothetical protein